MKRKTGKIVTQTSSEDQAMKDAADRVYRKYGNDLEAFFRDARRQEALEGQQATQRKGSEA